MKPGFLVAIAGAAIVVAGLAGCGGDEKPSTATPPATVSVPGQGTVASGSGKAKVTIDGQDQSVQGSISCIKQGGNVAITVGTPSATAPQGITALVTDADPPVVQTVVLGNVGNTALGVGGGQGNAEAKKDGNTYKITGTASGVDIANPLQPLNKPFEMEVTCP